MSNVVCAFGLTELVEQRSDAVPGGCDGSFVGFSEQGFQFGDDLLDWVQVRAVRWQEQQMCAGCANGPSHGQPFVAAQIVEHDDVAGPQSWHQDSVGTRNCTTQARKTAPLIGPSMTQGAVMPSARNAARKVMVTQWPCGTRASRR